MIIRFALPCIFSAAFFSGAVLSVASVGIEDENGTVFAADLDRLAGFGALVEQVAAWLRIGNPFADSLPRRLNGLEGSCAKCGHQVVRVVETSEAKPPNN